MTDGALRLVLFRRWGITPADIDQLPAGLRAYLARHLLGDRRAVAT